MQTSAYPIFAVAALFLAGCTPYQTGHAIIQSEADQDPAIAVNAARYDLAQAEALPLLQRLSCGPFRIDIRTPRTAPGPGGQTPHLAMVIHQPDDLQGSVRFTRDNFPFADTRILYRTPAGWQDVTSAATALGLGASPLTVIEPEPGARTIQAPRHLTVELGSDPARSLFLVLDGKYATTQTWTADQIPGEPYPADAITRARPGEYRIVTAAEYGLAWSGGECSFQLPDLVWRMPG